MCLVAIAANVSPRYELVLAANRDELYTRPARPLARWNDAPRIVGGRDLDKGGAWLALRDDGRFALVTNHRDFRRPRREGAPSRGEIVTRATEDDRAPHDYVAALAMESNVYEPFNLLLGDRRAIVWHSNVTGAIATLAPGVHGLSNALLDTPWPKVEALKQALEGALELEPMSLAEVMLAALASRAEAPPDHLPDTGVGPDLEAHLSPAFIHMSGYGTRCSSVITIDRGGHVRFVERTFDAEGQETGTREVSFDRLP